MLFDFVWGSVYDFARNLLERVSNVVVLPQVDQISMSTPDMRLYKKTYIHRYPTKFKTLHISTLESCCRTQDIYIYVCVGHTCIGDKRTVNHAGSFAADPKQTARVLHPAEITTAV